MMFAMIWGFVQTATAQVKTTDSLFLHNSRPIQFVVDKININDRDRKWITDSLIPALKALEGRGIVLGRAAASPEGSTANNKRLANGRRAAVDTLLNSYGISTDRIRYDVVTEDYPLMRALMWLNHDSYLPAVDDILRRGGNTWRIKGALMAYDGGKLWKRLLRYYFPKLRAVRIMAIDELLVESVPVSSLVAKQGGIVLPPLDFHFSLQGLQPVSVPVARKPLDEPRRELLSIKTNLLFDFAYMPGYGRFCPIPNVAIEYYPLRGHFTYGASFDGPWWQHYREHRYFQVRNYQIHTRYYLRSGDILQGRPGEGAAFKGLYFSAYAHAGLYNICFGERRGWEGEGWGGGMGYVVPLGRSEHWRLEFGLQGGFFRTLYDPYQWKCPVKPDTDPELYYYKWYGDANDFQKRKHRYSWLGPTRVEITLSYDLLYRRNHKNGASFRSRERVKGLQAGQNRAR